MLSNLQEESFFVFTVKLCHHALELNVDSDFSVNSNQQSISVCSGSYSIKASGESSSYLKDIMKKGFQLNLMDFIGYCFSGAEDFREFLMAYQIKEGHELIFDFC